MFHQNLRLAPQVASRRANLFIGATRKSAPQSLVHRTQASTGPTRAIIPRVHEQNCSRSEFRAARTNLAGGGALAIINPRVKRAARGSRNPGEGGGGGERVVGT